MNTKIWITVPTHNRKTIARICLKQLAKHKKDSFLHVSDDHSSEFDAVAEFSQWADKVERTPKKMGVQHLRCWEFRDRRSDQSYVLALFDIQRCTAERVDFDFSQIVSL